MIRNPREERRTFTGQYDVADTLNVLFTTAAKGGRGKVPAEHRPLSVSRPQSRRDRR